MPIEIKELHIRVTVNTPSSARPHEPEERSRGLGGPSDNEAKEAIVAECVEQVLKILKNKEER